MIDIGRRVRVIESFPVLGGAEGVVVGTYAGTWHLVKLELAGWNEPYPLTENQVEILIDKKRFNVNLNQKRFRNGM